MILSLMPGLPAETQCLDEPSAFAEFTLFTKLERIFDARYEKYAPAAAAAAPLTSVVRLVVTKQIIGSNRRREGGLISEARKLSRLFHLVPFECKIGICLT